MKDFTFKDNFMLINMLSVQNFNLSINLLLTSWISSEDSRFFPQNKSRQQSAYIHKRPLLLAVAW